MITAYLTKISIFFKKILTTKIGYIFLGISSTLWFLIRVIPKPSRASYPCMQAAAPIMSSTVIYLISLFGGITAYRKTKLNFKQSRYALGSLFLVLTIVLSVVFIAENNVSVFAAVENSVVANAPVGVGRGVFPGRVVWIFNPSVAKFDGKTGFWWDENNTVQAESDKMMKATIMRLAGIDNEKKAWSKLFVYFNKTKKNKLKGYTAGEKIAIKINSNNSFDSHRNVRNINASPQLILSLLSSLIVEAGVPQNCITIFDASRYITDNIFDKCHAVFPEVNFVDNVGGDGRIKTSYVQNAITWSSINNKSPYRSLASCAVEADYLINMAILKGHSAQGVTLCAKNWFGVTDIHSDYKLNRGAHGYFSANKEGKDAYMTFVDYMGHKDLGEKTVLFLIDGLYAQNEVSGIPHLKWQMKPFNNRWPSSLFASQDGVAIDAVGLDFLRSEWPDMIDLKYSEKYLVEAALANNPPSKTFYDPEKDGTRCLSLGVMETWNNPEQKQYSRNLGKKEGIELNFKDLSNTKR
jgi:hypothetical protein